MTTTDGLRDTTPESFAASVTLPDVGSTTAGHRAPEVTLLGTYGREVESTIALRALATPVGADSQPLRSHRSTNTLPATSPTARREAERPREDRAVQQPPARVLVVGLNYLPEPTGIAPYTTSLAEGLAGSGSSVHVITSYPHYPQWRIADGYDGHVRHEDEGGVSLTRLKPLVPRRANLLARLRMEVAFGLHAVLTQWRQPDVALLVTPALFATAIASMGARLRGVPTCVWVQDIYSLGISETGRGALLGRLMGVIEGRILRSADSVVVIHERFRRHLLTELDVPAEKVHVVRNWTHLQPTTTLDRAETRRLRGWGRDDVIVLHAGNMGAKQGLKNVVDAARLARSRGSNVRFVLLGDGNQREHLKSLDEHGDVEFLEPLPDEEFQATLHAADILLVNERPGLRAMCVPSKLTSYFSTGLPVIAATDAESITAEEIALAGAGLRVDAARPSALVDAAEYLASDAAAARRFGSAGRVFRQQQLSADLAVSRFGGLLSSLDRVDRAEAH